MKWTNSMSQDKNTAFNIPNLPTTLTLLKVAGSKQKPIHIGRSRLRKMSVLNFRQLPVANGTAFSKIFKNEDNLARYTQIFEKLTRKFSFQLTLLSEFLTVFGWMVRISETQQLSEFLETFPGNSVPFAAVSKLNFRKFCLNARKRPSYQCGRS